MQYIADWPGRWTSCLLAWCLRKIAMGIQCPFPNVNRGNTLWTRKSNLHWQKSKAIGYFTSSSSGWSLHGRVDPIQMNEWWLLDSGASRSVLSSKWVHQYNIIKERTLQEPLKFSTASGELVSIDREVHCKCLLETYRQGRLVKQATVLRALVADVQHNLLSTSQMVRMGWTVTFSPESGPQFQFVFFAGPWPISRHSTLTLVPMPLAGVRNIHWQIF